MLATQAILPKKHCSLSVKTLCPTFLIALSKVKLTTNNIEQTNKKKEALEKETEEDPCNKTHWRRIKKCQISY